MWFISVEVEQETSAPPPKKKSWIRPWLDSKFLKLAPLAFMESVVLSEITHTAIATKKKIYKLT